jgi:hypothetical protein
MSVLQYKMGKFYHKKLGQIGTYERFTDLWRFPITKNQPKHPATLQPARSRLRPCMPLPVARSGWEGGQSLNGAWPLTTERKTEIGKKIDFMFLNKNLLHHQMSPS